MNNAFADNNRLVVVRSGLDSADAALLRSLLEGNGVQVFVANENVASMNQGMWADLYVRASDRARAEAILGKVATLPRCAIPVRRDEDGEELACVHCGSTRVHPFEGAVPTVVPGVRRQARLKDHWYHCLQCDSYYQEGRRPRFSGLPVALAWGGLLGLATLGVIWLIEYLRYL
ncbi:MAG: DUF2007 domain-containing protein [Alphaproteobacteria bacterium]|nr:MAG: DUF2007 domain-containing protein [Alphaproteobacteria bacterium]